MDESDSTSRRIETLKSLVAEYALLDYGVAIDKHTERLRVCDIRDSVNENHPHDTLRVYITRRSLKHFVEERKIQLEKRHGEEEILSYLYFAIENLPETVVNFEKYEREEPSKHFYARDYSALEMPQLRVLVEKRGDCLEICSIHFKKLRKEK